MGESSKVGVFVDEDISKVSGQLNNLGLHANPEHFGIKTTSPKTMEDKLRLLENTPTDVGIFFDFGTATGKLLQAKRDSDISLGKKNVYVGYDIDPNLIEEAKKDGQDILFTADLKEALAYIKASSKESGKSVLVLSSIIHEIIHYQPEEEQKAFWEDVWSSEVDYVAIRDFNFGSELRNQTAPEGLVGKIRDKMGDKDFVEGHPLAGKNILDVWENGFEPIPDNDHDFFRKGFDGWGSMDNMHVLTQFLIQFDLLGTEAQESALQVEGAREIHENIASVSFDGFMDLVPSFFKPVFKGFYQDDHRKNLIEETFDIKPEELPMYKMQVVLERQKSKDSSELPSL